MARTVGRVRHPAQGRRRSLSLPPLVGLLHVGPSPAPGAAWIAFSELPSRLHELPAKFVPIRVLDSPDAEAAAAFLMAGGRKAVVTVEAGEGPPGRLWSPNPLVERLIRDSEPGSVVDLGCGAGREAVALALSGWTVRAYDRLPSSVAQVRDLAARYGGHLTAEVADARELGWSAPWNLMLRWHDRGLLGARPPERGLVLEAFTPEHRARHGRPADPLALADVPVFGPSLAEANERDGGLHTLRVIDPPVV